MDKGYGKSRSIASPLPLFLIFLGRHKGLRTSYSPGEELRILSFLSPWGKAEHRKGFLW